MRFDYIAPGSIKEAISLLGKHNGRAKVIAGGTDLVPQIRNKICKPEYVIDVSCITGLDYIKYDKQGGVSIGTATPIKTLEKSAELNHKHPVIPQAASLLGSTAIRNVATIGGNISNGSPSAETVPSLIALSAKVKIAGAKGENIVPLEEFFVGPSKTVLGKDDLLVEIQVPPQLPGTRGVYLKHSIRGTVDLAIVGVAIAIIIELDKTCKDIKIVLGAVAPTPLRAKKAEEILRGKKIDNSSIEICSQTASDEARPISDVRASAKYRKEMVKVFTRRALKQAMAG